MLIAYFPPLPVNLLIFFLTFTILIWPWYTFSFLTAQYFLLSDVFYSLLLHSCDKCVFGLFFSAANLCYSITILLLFKTCIIYKPLFDIIYDWNTLCFSKDRLFTSTKSVFTCIWKKWLIRNNLYPLQ